MVPAVIFMSLCIFCPICNLPYAHTLFRLISIAKYILSSLSIGYGGTKFEIFRENVTYFHSILLRHARLFDENYLQVQKKKDR